MKQIMAVENPGCQEFVSCFTFETCNDWKRISLMLMLLMLLMMMMMMMMMR